MAVYPERRASGLTGKWVAEVTQHGERRRKRFDTKLEATRWADFTKLTGAPPEAATTAKAAHTFGAVVAELKERTTESRDRSRDQRLEHCVGIFGADTAVENIKTADFDRLVSDLKKRPGLTGANKLSPGSINRYLSAASSAMRYAWDREYIAALPKVPWQAESGKRIHWLTNDQQSALALAMLSEGGRDEELTLRVLTATGLRWGEFEGLTVGQVAGTWIKLDKTKTNQPRDVPIDEALAAELVEMLRKRGVPKYYTFRRSLKRALKIAGQSEALSVHSLRHTTATRLVHGDVNLAVVKDFLGHASINTTLKYTHVTASKLQEAAKKLSPHAGQSTPSDPSETLINQGFPDGKLMISPKR
jgi:site-specific recombinase XerD